jgi:hypothetical protein
MSRYTIDEVPSGGWKCWNKKIPEDKGCIGETPEDALGKSRLFERLIDELHQHVMGECEPETCADCQRNPKSRGCAK